nr:MAG TPA: hypothetical protein [Caudoviricetes sp.]
MTLATDFFIYKVQSVIVSALRVLRRANGRN